LPQLILLISFYPVQQGSLWCVFRHEFSKTNLKIHALPRAEVGKGILVFRQSPGVRIKTIFTTSRTPFNLAAEYLGESPVQREERFTNYVKLDLSWDISRFSFSQNVLAFYGTRKFRILSTRTPHFSLSWARLIQFTSSSSAFFKIHFSIIHPYNLGSSKKSVLLVFLAKSYMNLSPLPFTRHMLRPCHPTS
jgi:hypothetical protein